MTPKYTNKIPISIGDIFKCRYPSCYGKVTSIDLINVPPPAWAPTRNDDYYEVKFEKICGGTLKPYKKPREGRARYNVRHGGLPFRIEPDSFDEIYKNLTDLMTMVQ